MSETYANPHDRANTQSPNDNISPSGSPSGSVPSTPASSPPGSPPMIRKPDLPPITPGFEGPEKRLEVHFTRRPGAVSSASLNSLPRSVWDAVVTDAKAEILSESVHGSTRAFVLSESSLFVTPDSLMIKTCGTTTLIKALPRILAHAHACGLSPSRLTYSRRSYLFPSAQPPSHSSWSVEIDGINQVLSSTPWIAHDFTASDLVGVPTTKSTSPVDCNSTSPWPTQQDAENTWHFWSARWPSCVTDDKSSSAKRPPTLEIMMTGLCPSSTPIFFNECENEEEEQKESPKRLAGVNALFESLAPAAVQDGHLFSPCGYSLNALGSSDGSKDPGIVSVHVTPESHCSFISFETSTRAGTCDVGATVRKVVSAFRPSQVLVALVGENPVESSWTPPKGYESKDLTTQTSATTLSSELGLHVGLVSLTKPCHS